MVPAIFHAHACHAEKYGRQACETTHPPTPPPNHTVHRQCSSVQCRLHYCIHVRVDKWKNGSAPRVSSYTRSLFTSSAHCAREHRVLMFRAPSPAPTHENTYTWGRFCTSLSRLHWHSYLPSGFWLAFSSISTESGDALENFRQECIRLIGSGAI